MKQGSPIHFVARVFETIAPNAQRTGRKTERRGILGKPQAARVHRFDMHAPKRPKSDRTAVRARAVAIARTPPAPLPLLLFGLPFQLVPAQFLQMFRTFAQILRAHQMARSLLERRDRKLAPAAILLRLLMAAVPGLNMRRPVRVVRFCPGTARRHRRSSMLRRNPTCSDFALPKVCAGTGRLQAPDYYGKIKRIFNPLALHA
jgi:hypothetical protein